MSSPCGVQAAASLDPIAAAIAVCESMRANRGAVGFAEVASQVTACSLALSSPDVAAALCDAVLSMCDEENNSDAEANRVTFGAAGAIPVIVAAAMSTHGAVSTRVAVKSCAALGFLTQHNAINADAVVVATGGLDAILAVMRSHAENGTVQGNACFALYHVAGAVRDVARRAMRESAAGALIETAKRVHDPSDEGVALYADGALARLRV